MKVLRILMLALWLPMVATAQVTSAEQRYKEKARKALEQAKKQLAEDYGIDDFEEYKRQKRQEFEDYRKRMNAEFAEYMRKAWPKYAVKKGEPVPKRPEPPQPVVKNPDEKPTIAPVPLGQIIPQRREPQTKPTPLVKVPTVPVAPVEKGFSFSFYGTPCTVPLEARHRFRLSGVDENRVADGWNVLSGDQYTAVVEACLSLRNTLQLCDWGYLRLLERMTESFFGAGGQNEARLMQMFILTQSGYKVRLARTGQQLCLLLPSEDVVYEYSYVLIRGQRYYVIDKERNHQSLAILDHKFPKEQSFSLRMDFEPLLAVNSPVTNTLTSKRYAELSVQLAVNKNLIDFYNDYPLTDDWSIYVCSSLSQQVKEQLYPVLRQAIAGKSEKTAANMLINFVQTALQYKTDEEQFGTERPLFGDETLYYPFSDCEDRAILYAVLVRELLGLEVVLIYYPQHLATAVCFREDVAGSYFTHDGRRYVVCDPTYIGASIGESMPQFRQSEATVIQIGQ